MSKGQRRNSRAARSSGGFALSGIAAILCVTSILMVIVGALCLDGYYYYCYNGKAQIIAEETANLVGRRSFFLGANRPQFQTTGTSTQELARQYAEQLAKMAQLPDKTRLEVKVLQNNIADANLAVTKVQVSISNVPLPANIPGTPAMYPELDAIGVATGANQAPPAFIRLGFKLIDPSQSNPSVTDATQVVMLPAYGFQTDAGGVQNLGGTQNNNDVVGNQPDASQCLWAGVNASPDALASDAPYVNGPNGRQVKAFN